MAMVESIVLWAAVVMGAFVLILCALSPLAMPALAKIMREKR